MSDFELKLSNASDFEMKILQRVKNWFKCFTTRQILDWKKIQLAFEMKIFWHVRFWKMFQFKKSRFGSFCSVKTTYFAFFVLQKHDFEVKILLCQILNWEKYNAPDFEFKKNTTRHSLNLKKYNASDFE